MGLLDSVLGAVINNASQGSANAAAAGGAGVSMLAPSASSSAALGAVQGAGSGTGRSMAGGRSAARARLCDGRGVPEPGAARATAGRAAGARWRC